MKQITSRDNPLFKSLLELVRSARARQEQGRVVLDGVHLVHSYLERFGAQGVELVVKDSAADHSEIRSLLQRAPAVRLADMLFDSAAPVRSPVGILAFAPRPEVPDPGAGFQVLLDGIQDPGNLGAILRSAAAAGGSKAHLSPHCTDPWSPRALRGGMGAQFLLPTREHEDLAAAARGLGMKLIACTAHATTSLFEADLSGSIGFIIGGEGAGLSAPLVATADLEIKIPMRPGTESLNAGAAAAICFYEWYRRHGR